MAKLPKCPNYAKRRGCERSDIRLIGEGGDHWTFECGTCHLTWVVSKPTEIAASKLRVEEEQLRKAAERRRRHDSRTKIFT